MRWTFLDLIRRQVELVSTVGGPSLSEAGGRPAPVRGGHTLSGAFEQPIPAVNFLCCGGGRRWGDATQSGSRIVSPKLRGNGLPDQRSSVSAVWRIGSSRPGFLAPLTPWNPTIKIVVCSLDPLKFIARALKLAIPHVGKMVLVSIT